MIYRDLLFIPFQVVFTVYTRNPSFQLSTKGVSSTLRKEGG